MEENSTVRIILLICNFEAEVVEKEKEIYENLGNA